MTSDEIHTKAVELLHRVDALDTPPMTGVSESDPRVMQVRALNLIAEAIALLVIQATQEHWQPDDAGA